MTRRLWTDTPLISLVALALCVEVMLLLHQMRVIDLPLNLGRETGSRRAIATVAAVRNELRVRSEGGLSWFPAAAGDTVMVDDIVMTGPTGWARVRVEPDGEVELGPNSMVRFSERSEKSDLPVLAIEVARGRAGVRSRSRPLQLTLREQSLRIEEGSAIAINAEPLVEETRIDVESGAVVALPDSESPAASVESEKRFETGQAIAVRPTDVTAVVKELAFDPVSPARGAILTLGSGEAIAFAWNGDEAGAIEIAAAEDFSGAVRVPASDRKASHAPKPGRYFWRLRDGVRRGVPSAFVVRPPVTIALREPAARVSLRETEKVILRWQRVDLAAGYAVEVATDEAFSKIVVSEKASGPVLELPKLAAGTYYWRVRAEHPVYGEWPFSAPRRFDLRKVLAPPKTKGVKIQKKKSEAPSRKKRSESLVDTRSLLARVGEGVLSAVEWIDLALFPRAYAAEPSIRLNFEWKAVEGAVAYRFELGRDKTFTQVLHTEEIRDTQIGVDLEINRVYFWRVRGVDEDGEPGQPSTPQRVVPKRLLEIYRRAGGGSDEETQRVRIVHAPTLVDIAVTDRIGYHLQNVSDSVTAIKTRGVTVNRPELRLRIGNPAAPWEARAWFQNMSYRSRVSELSGLQGPMKQAQFGGQLVWQSPLVVGAPLKVGLLFERLPALRRSSAVVSAETKNYFAAILGQTYRTDLGRNLGFAADVFLEGAPLGELRGIGGQLRGRFQHRKLAADLGGMILSPELEIGIFPSLRWAQPDGRRVFTTDFSLSLFFSAQFLS